MVSSSRMKLSGVLAILLCLTRCLASDENPAVASDNSAVVKLNSKNLQSFISENSLVLLEFFAPWCGHCKNLGPELEEAAETLIEKDIMVAQIDCTENDEFCKKHQVKGYPTLKVFKGNESESSAYSGKRKAATIVDFMIKKSLPNVWVLNTLNDLEDALQIAMGTVVVQLYKELDLLANSTFLEVADDLNEELIFIRISDPAMNDKYHVEAVKYLVFRPDEQDEAPGLDHTVGTTSGELKEFIKKETTPLFGEINGSTFQQYTDANLPLAYYFYNEPTEKLLVSPLIIKLAKELRGKMNFVALNAKRFAIHASNLNMQQEFPLFAIHDLTTNSKFGISQDTPLDNNDIEPYVRQFLAGELKPIIKSEPIPTQEELDQEAVLKLVGKTHDDIILDKSKITLVEYYAPWCGHCKTLAPIYEELAQQIKNDTVAKDQFVIAKIDATANDVGLAIKGFPTIFLYNKLDEPIKFDGARDLQTLASFIGFTKSSKGEGEVSGKTGEVKEEIPSHDEL